MADAAIDILAMGDAIVDVIASCDEAFLDAHHLPKGSMQLLTPAEADSLYAAMGQAREMSGGSAANSMAGIAAMGGKAAFIGQIADDQLGTIFEHDMHALGVRFETPPLAGDLPTGRCLILVTPDAQRTMNTCPGASHELDVGALDEALQLTGRADPDSALTELAAKVATLVVTRGADGATAISHGERISITAASVAQIVDTTGAGDLFAAGFLTARAKGASLERCLWTGAIAAGEVIKHYGARPIVDLKALVQL